jgi:hypothetical protein
VACCSLQVTRAATSTQLLETAAPSARRSRPGHSRGEGPHGSRHRTAQKPPPMAGSPGPGREPATPGAGASPGEGSAARAGGAPRCGEKEDEEEEGSATRRGRKPDSCRGRSSSDRLLGTETRDAGAAEKSLITHSAGGGTPNWAGAHTRDPALGGPLPPHPRPPAGPRRAAGEKRADTPNPRAPRSAAPRPPRPAPPQPGPRPNSPSPPPPAPPLAFFGNFRGESQSSAKSEDPPPPSQPNPALCLRRRGACADAIFPCLLRGSPSPRRRRRHHRLLLRPAVAPPPPALGRWSLLSRCRERPGDTVESEKSTSNNHHSPLPAQHPPSAPTHSPAPCADTDQPHLSFL